MSPQGAAGDLSLVRLAVERAMQAGALSPALAQQALAFLARPQDRQQALQGLEALGVSTSLLADYARPSSAPISSAPTFVDASAPRGRAPGDETARKPITRPLALSDHAVSRRAGARIGAFVVLEEIGQGGMGVVLKARHDDGRIVALKLMTIPPSENAARRFAREIDALGRLEHPHIVRLVSGSTEPPAHLAMEFVPGVDLDRRLGRGTVSHVEVARIVSEVAYGVAHAHREGIIHRDLKPANVLLREPGKQAVVTDFGLTRDLDGSRFTKTGVLVGTLPYMSPEQVAGERGVGSPTDVWALGAILYRCLCGRDPFRAESQLALAVAISQGHLVPPRKVDPSIPQDLAEICLACLNPDPARRPTASQVAKALKQRRSLAEGRAPRGRRSLLGAALALALVAGGVGWALREPASTPEPAVAGARGLEAAADPVGSTDTGPLRPWGEPTKPWRRSWDLVEGPEPAVANTSLWTRAGRVADPLAGTRGLSRGEADQAFLGTVRRRGPGRIEVRYQDLGRALRVRDLNPAGFFLGEDPQRPRAPSDPGEAHLLNANDAGLLEATLGLARWESPRLTLRVRRLEHVDSDLLRVRLGVGRASSEPVSLAFSGRGGTATIQGYEARRKARSEVLLDERWRELSLAPGAEPETRVLLDGAALTGPDSDAPDSPPPGGITFEVLEGRFALSDVRVEGRPLRPDVPALARAPCALPASARVAAAFTREPGPELGGPFVALLPASDSGRLDLGVCLEWDVDRLVLRREGQVLAVKALAKGGPTSSSEGTSWLLLERRADALRGLLVRGDLRDELVALDPLPLRALALQAAYGSTAPRVEFLAVEVQAGPADPERSALDRACAEGGLVAAQTRLAEQQLHLGATATVSTLLWRQGALLLARVSDPAYADSTLVGVASSSARRQVARAAAHALHGAIPGLRPAALRRDARARLVLARVVSANADKAQDAAKKLLRALGREEGCSAVDRLERDQEAPALLGRLAKGYVAVLDLETHEAALRAALVLVPEQEGLICLGLADCVRNRRPRPDPKTPEGLLAYKGALALFGRAREAGIEGKKIDSAQADALMDMGRWGDALALWDRFMTLRSRYAWAWLRAAVCQANLGRTPDALATCLGALATARARPDVHRLLVDLVQKASPKLAGLRAVAVLALAREREESQRESYREAAGKLARSLSGDAELRQADLAVYVRVRLGEPLRGRAQGDRPTAVLARAAAGDAQALTALRGATDADVLVWHLVRLDPELSARLR